MLKAYIFRVRFGSLFHITITIGYAYYTGMFGHRIQIVYIFTKKLLPRFILTEKRLREFEALLLSVRELDAFEQSDAIGSELRVSVVTCLCWGGGNLVYRIAHCLSCTDNILTPVIDYLVQLMS